MENKKISGIEKEHDINKKYDRISEFEKLMEENGEEKNSFNHPRPEIFILRSSGETTPNPEWIKDVALRLAGGDEKIVISFPPNIPIDEITDLNLFQYKMAAILNDGSIVDQYDIREKLKTENDYDMIEAAKKLPGVRRIVFVAE